MGMVKYSLRPLLSKVLSLSPEIVRDEKRVGRGRVGDRNSQRKLLLRLVSIIVMI